MKTIVDIDKTFNKSYSWVSFENTFAIGFAYVFDDYYDAIDICKIINNFNNISDIQNWTEKLNGSYSYIKINNNEIICAVDRMRTFPIFYCCSQVVSISNNAYKLLKYSNKKINKHSEIEYLYTGYTTMNSTLIENIKQVIAGQILIIKKNGETNVKKYYEFGYLGSLDELNSSEDELICKLDKILINVFSRAIRIANGRTIVIPLSGGQDSRLCLIMLKRLGYDNIISYTYGLPNSNEVIKSKLVADNMNCKWIYIEYDASTWNNLVNTNFADEYSHFCGNLNSVPHFQDYTAVKKLKELKLIPDDSIFMPGHAYNVPTGDHLKYMDIKRKTMTRRKLSELIYYRHYHYRKKNRYEYKIVKRIIDKQLGDIKKLFGTEIPSYIQKWDWRERQCKFIINSLRVYEYFGYGWSTPLWDNELVEFWMKIPLKYLYRRKLHFIYANKYMAPFSNINDPIPNSKPTLFEFIADNNFKNYLVTHFYGKKHFKNLRKVGNGYYEIFSDKELMNLCKKNGVKFGIGTIVTKQYIDMLKESEMIKYSD